MKYLRRGSGYYIDVGAAQLVANGEVKLVRGQVKELTVDAVVLQDVTTLPADLVVYATGYGSMNGWAADPISQEVADRVGKVWGLGSATTKDPGPWEGEQRNMWKPTQQESLWFHGGNLHQSHHYSLYLARSSRRASKASRLPSMDSRRSTTCPDTAPHCAPRSPRGRRQTPHGEDLLATTEGALDVVEGGRGQAHTPGPEDHRGVQPHPAGERLAPQVHGQVDVGEHPLAGVLPHGNPVRGVDDAEEGGGRAHVDAFDERGVGAEPDLPASSLVARADPPVQRGAEAAAPRGRAVPHHQGVRRRKGVRVATAHVAAVLRGQSPRAGPHDRTRTATRVASTSSMVRPGRTVRTVISLRSVGIIPRIS